ncbi:MAG: hypothetical protein RIF41_29110 [Polyangiaceae bacterium]
MDESEIRKLVMRRYAVALAVSETTAELRDEVMKATTGAVKESLDKLTASVVGWGGTTLDWVEGDQDYYWAWYPPTVEGRRSSWIVRLRINVEAVGGLLGLRAAAQLNPRIPGTSGATLRDELGGRLHEREREGWASDREIARQYAIGESDGTVEVVAQRLAGDADELLGFLAQAYAAVMKQLGEERGET